MMKSVISVFLACVVLTQALIPRDILIPEDQLFPKKSLEEWQEILRDIEYVPSNATKSIGIPQPESAGKALNPRIIGGSRARLGQFPWQVAIHLDGSSFCGGSIISSKWVLTAAHCVYGIRSFTVLAGTTSSSGGGQQSSTSRKVAHSQYSPNTLKNDIAVIYVANGFSFNSNVNAVKLPSSNIGSLVGQSARISGWGKTSDHSSVSSTLNWVDLPIVSSNNCANVYGSFSASQICASGANRRSTCNGDSGGPLVIAGSDGRWTEVGVVSFGSSAGCTQGYPVGFTRVSSFLNWISANTGLAV